MEKSKTTIYDVAEYLGVATATVNRVLNNKPNVSEKMRKKVLDAVEELNYRPSKTASSLNRQPIYVVMIIPKHNIDFFPDKIILLPFPAHHL